MSGRNLAHDRGYESGSGPVQRVNLALEQGEPGFADAADLGHNGCSTTLITDCRSISAKQRPITQCRVVGRKNYSAGGPKSILSKVTSLKRSTNRHAEFKSCSCYVGII